MMIPEVYSSLTLPRWEHNDRYIYCRNIYNSFNTHLCLYFHLALKIALCWSNHGAFFSIVFLLKKNLYYQNVTKPAALITLSIITQTVRFTNGHENDQISFFLILPFVFYPMEEGHQPYVPLKSIVKGNVQVVAYDLAAFPPTGQPYAYTVPATCFQQHK